MDNHEDSYEIVEAHLPGPGDRIDDQTVMAEWERFKTWLRGIVANTIIHCFIAFIPSVVIDVLAAYTQAILGLKLPAVANVALGGASYLAMYYLIRLIKK